MRPIWDLLLEASALAAIPVVCLCFLISIPDFAYRLRPRALQRVNLSEVNVRKLLEQIGRLFNQPRRIRLKRV